MILRKTMLVALLFCGAFALDAQTPVIGPTTLLEWDAPGTAHASNINFAANSTRLNLFNVTASLTVSKITYDIQTADNTANTYDVGIYSFTGNLLCHIGATAGTTFAPATGLRTLSMLSPCNLQPGNYFFAFTGSAGTAAFYHGGNQPVTGYMNLVPGNAATSGGVLNATAGTITPLYANNWGFPSISLHN